MIIVVARLLRLLCRRFGQPEVVGEIAAGSLLGLTLLFGPITRDLFAADIRPALVVPFATVLIGVARARPARRPHPTLPRGLGRYNIFGAFPLGAVTLRESTATLRARVLTWTEWIARTVLQPSSFAVTGFAVELSGIDR